MSVEQLLQQDVISVTRNPEALGNAPSSVFLIRGTSAEASGATTLPEVLRLAPNLFVAQSSASSWAVSSRGFTRTNSRSNKLLVMIDGRTVYSPLFSGVFWDTQDVFLPDLDRAEVISGPGGSTWGSNAVNGVINIVTKSSRNTQGGVAYASFGGEVKNDFGARYGGSFSRDGFFRVYAKRTDFDSTLSATGVDDGADAWTFTQAGFRIDTGDAYSGEFSLQGDGYAGRYATGGPRVRNEGANINARWQRRFADASTVVVRFYHDYTLRDVPDSIAERLHTTDVDFQQNTRASPRNQLTWGGNYRFMHENIRNAPGGFAILPARTDLHLGSAFLEDEFAIVPEALRLTLGSRFERNDYTGWEIQPSARLAWTVRPQQTLWAAVSRAARTPSRIDTEFFFPQSPPFIINGGPDFSSEILKAYELGWRGSPARGLATTLTLFYHDYDDLRSVEPTSPIVTANGVEGHSYGAEAFADWDVTKAWRLRLGYFRLVEETHLKPGSNDTDRGRGESSDPAYQIQLRSGFALARNLQLWGSLRRVAAVPASEGAVTGLVPAYTELDARIGWTIRPGLELSFIGRNLLDRSHPEIGSDAARREIERSLQARVRWEF